MTEITINFTYIFAVMYVVLKGAASIWICKHEFQYPIWNKEGVQISRGIHHKLQAFLRNLVINPEWGLLKVIAFAPVFLVTGKRFIHFFMPWKIQKTPAFCQQCGDKGRYYIPSFLDSGDGGWHTCKCRSKPELPEELPKCVCHVCLDQGTIGKNRPCPHCERRGRLARHAQAKEHRSQFGDSEYCAGCTELHDTKNLTRLEGCWSCRKCLPKVARQLVRSRTLATTRNHLPVNKVQHNPLRYMTERDCMLGDPHNMKECVWSRSVDDWLRRNPTEIHVGDSIVIQAVQSGHRDQSKLGSLLRVLGVNLPYLVVKLSRDIRYIDIIDVRGMVIYSERGIPVATKEEYQPLLNPVSLEVGDKFVIMNVREKGTDGSWRGHGFRVTKTAYQDRLRNGSLVIDAKHLSGMGMFCMGVIKIMCDRLQIISVNDQYVNASKPHCPDIGLGLA